MPIIGSLIGGIGSGLAGLFGGGNQQKTKTSGTITNNQTGSFNTGSTSSTSPNLTPLQKALIGQFTQGASQLYNQSTNLAPYEASGLSQINSGTNAAETADQANLARMGQSFSPASATAANQANLARTSQQSQFANSIPLLQRQLQQQSLQQLMQAFQVIPTGTTQTGTQTGTTTQNGTQTQQGTNLISGNPLGGLFSGISSGGIAGFGLGNLYNSFGNNGSSGGFTPQGPSTSLNYNPNDYTGLE